MVEAKDTFLQKEMEVLTGNAVVFSEDAFGLVPEVFNAVDVVGFVGEAFTVVDPIMFKFTDINRIVRSIAVGIDDAVRLDFTLYNGHQSGAGSITNHHRINFAATF